MAIKEDFFKCSPCVSIISIQRISFFNDQRISKYSKHYDRLNPKGIKFKMKKNLLLGLIALLSLSANIALAGGECGGCTIKSVGVGPYYDAICGKASCTFVAVTGSIQGKPACAGTDWNFVIDTSTISGRTSLSMLLTAYAANKSINIAGSGQCTLFSAGENFLYAY